jgi:arginine decarboxylase
MYHQWNRIAFLHWRYSPQTVQRFLPAGLTADTCDGTAWIGVTPFLMEGVRPPALPPLPWLSRFGEVNVRTYVRDARGRRGIWFLSLDAARLPAVLAARAGYQLPYFWSGIRVTTRGGLTSYRCRRHDTDGTRCDAEVETGPPLAGPDELAEFLTARYRLFTVIAGRLAAAEAEHRPWPLHQARVLSLEQTLLPAAGLPAPAGAPLAHASPGVTVRIGMWHLVPAARSRLGRSPPGTRWRMDHDNAPVLDAIQRFRREDKYTFALPGHRLGRGVDERTAGVLSLGAFEADVIMAKSAASEAEALLADAVGARQAVFATCGSSVSIHTAVLTVTGPGRKILVNRNVHKSVVAALILAGASPVWLHPRWDHERQIAHPASAGDVAAALEREPDISSVLIITPTEYGTGADVRGIAAICRGHGIPLVVDEAWGAHFPFHPEMPTPAIQAGADLVVQSLHKAGGGLCQASVILVGGNQVDSVDLRLRLDLLTTTSPSALLYGSIDGFRRHMVTEGRQLLDAALQRTARLRERLQALTGLTVMDDSVIGHDTVAEWDPLKLSIDVSALGITGYQAKDWLEAEHQLEVQFGDARRVVCSLTYSDNDVAFERLGRALEALAAAPPAPDRPATAVPPLEDLNLKQAMSPRDAFFARTEQAADPVGRVAAEMISPYPPGVPAILPGEVFNAPVVSYLRAGLAAGMTIPDAADPKLETFRVVAG